MQALPSALGELPPDVAKLVAALLTEVEFAPETTIFTEGDAGDAAYFVDEGEVRIQLERPEVDSESVLRYTGPGQAVGEVALLDRLPRSATAVAQTPVRARMITTGDLDALAEKEPAAVLAVTRALARDATAKLRLATTQLSDMMVVDSPDPMVDELVGRAARAQGEFAGWSEDKVDALLGALTDAFVAKAAEFAEATVAETHIGNVADKTAKNFIASFGVYQSLVGKVGAGTINVDDDRKITEIAAAVGVVFGLIPMTNPVATAYFKTLIALKSRNAIILSFHHAALGVGNQVGELAQSVLAEHGAPVDLVTWVKARGSRKLTRQFMTHPGVALVLATGGAAMVAAAYSSGTPALGVGPGNAPCWIAPDADIAHAAAAVVASKSFDNGVICGAEHNLVVDDQVVEGFRAELEREGAAVLTDEESAAFLAAIVDPETNRFRLETVGQSAALIAESVGITRPYEIKLIVVPGEWAGEDTPMAGEKMTPILSLFTVSGDDAAIDLSRRLLAFMGGGHTAIVHSQDPARTAAFGAAMPTSRILVNSPGSQGVVGVTTGLVPSLTLGCGTFGGNSTTDNVTFTHLRNVKRLAQFVDPDAADAG